MNAIHPLKNYCYIIIIIIFIILSSCIHHIKSEEYTVGDDEKWNTGVNYLEWSQKYNFTVGDILVFNYVIGQHDTFEVTHDTYQSCNSSNGVLNVYVSGNDRVTLTEAKTYWFICNVPDHCRGGMKFGVDVKQLTTNDDPPTIPGFSTPPSNQAYGKLAPRSSWLLGFIFISALLCKFQLDYI